ncbi:dihydrodipicolinate synthase family protein [Kosakonia radicincitans]|uniref:4-hydroxy-tetrahydrodipicolinate synthase n=2 Tax=Kosakonia radicincitans TaxID=283686 RepID=A0AAX2F016_9ENTR|nr:MULTISPECIES: dihydrodipicolinate synthase family protein [Kosakonia]MDP9569384.1 4-hydroxy-tetrahydrodipicolinate synthase [Kosakonia oryzae]KDE34361.1 dihydrodipicolinate synthase [Kosakonia radicincitans UMEnt01/12]MDD7996270.1 dihydrodipicolinate synthase family protein [Kosakonia radicincitans]PTA87935.1 dihydrodipicolinate synthase family protein [Kosakonia sp. H7A]QEM93899.1 dihydrodipicolinate synthase family protein [Kosakonia radicincitans]
MIRETSFSGVWCPSITPMNNEGKPDLSALSQHIARLAAAKIDVVLLMGSIGEFASFSLEERLLLIREARGMSPITMVANVSSTCFNDILWMADEAWRTGYDAVMVLPPYYYGQTQNQLLSYFRALGKAISGKWFAYNFPARTGCDLTPELVATLAAEFPDFAGIKETVDCQSHTRNMIQATAQVREDFAVLCGYDEYFIPTLLAGGAGVISGLNNVMPELFVQAREAWRQGDLPTLHATQQEIGKFMAIYAIGDDFVTTIKTVVSRKFGYCTPVSRNFGGTLNEAQCQIIDRVFGIQ